jgi:MFS family permease
MIVWGLGLVSLLTDAAADMVVPLLPAVLASVGGGPRSLGLMEGTAEGLSAGFKYLGGSLADRGIAARYLVVGGYGMAALVRPFYAFVGAPWHALLLRSVDRVGKGLRSAPRDAILAASVAQERRAYAFGIHRGMDNLGAVVGGLTSFLLLSVLELTLEQVLLASFVPGVLSTLVAAALLRRRTSNVPTPPEPPEPPEPPTTAQSEVGLTSAQPAFSARLKLVLGLVALFSLAGASDTFLMAHLLAQGVSLKWLPLIWIGLQLGKSLLNAPGGLLADRVGVAKATGLSWLLYAAAYLGFACSMSATTTMALFALYAFHFGLGEGAEKALITRLAPTALRGRALGANHAVVGLGLLGANVGFGLLYAYDPRAAFGAAAALSALAAIGLLAALRWLDSAAAEALQT